MVDMVNKIVVPVALILAIGGVAFTWGKVQKNIELLESTKKIQTEMIVTQQRQQIMTRLVQDLMVYSQKQPAIDEVLIPFGFKPAPAGAATSAHQLQPTTPATTAPKSGK